LKTKNSKVSLKISRIEKEQEKKNEIPMIKKTQVDRRFTKKEIAESVAKGSSATERAKLMAQSGKLVIKSNQR